MTEYMFKVNYDSFKARNLMRCKIDAYEKEEKLRTSRIEEEKFQNEFIRSQPF